MTDHSLRTLLAQIVGASMPIALGACEGVATTRADMTSAHASRPDAKSDHESNRWIASGGMPLDQRSRSRLEGLRPAGTTADAAPAEEPRCGPPAPEPDCLADFRVVIERTCLGTEIPDDAGADLSEESCHVLCGPDRRFCAVAATDPVSVTIRCDPSCAIGRRPAGLVGVSPPGAGGLGTYFAEIARLEAASISSFRTLGRELAAHGAPRSLLRATKKAAGDEIRHARSMRALADRFGGSVRQAVVEKRALRPLEEIGIENAVEGCVRETYGALTATWQARATRDAGIRIVMRRIAREETEHAVLSYRIDRWIRSRLDEVNRARMAAAKEAALSELWQSIQREPHDALVDIAGVPSAAHAQRLLEKMACKLGLGLSA